MAPKRNVQETQRAHQQIINNPTALHDVDMLMCHDEGMPLGEAILASRDNYYDQLFKCLETMKAEHGSIPVLLKYQLSLDMTEKQKKRLEAL